MAHDKPTPKMTETGAKDHDPQQKAKLRKSEDNVSTANQTPEEPNHPHPGNGPTGKHSGGKSKKTE